MNALTRKLTLVLHIISSVGWIGAIACFLIFATTAISSDSAVRLHSVYVAMDEIGYGVLVPLSLASLITGVIQSLATEWGLFKHYWVLFKFVLNLLATTVLIVFIRTLDLSLSQAQWSDPNVLEGLRTPAPVIHALVGLLILVTATVLSVFKPRGLTPYGWRRQMRKAEQRQS